MAFTILNDPAAPVNPAGFGDQAEIDKVDIDIIAKAFDGQFVISGCAVTAQASPDMTVAVAAGSALNNGELVTIAGGNVTITAADATNPRIDLVVANTDDSLSAVAGTANANPCMPDFTLSQVVLAAVYVPANDTAINSNQITDKRVIMDQYARLGGVGGGQTLYGGNGPSENLELGGTSNFTHTTSIISMLDHVRLASGKVIQDSGGNTRITLGTVTPHVTLTGDAHVTTHLAVGTTAPSSIRTLYVNDTVTGTSGSIAGAEFNLTYTPNAGSSIGYGLFGGAIVNGIAATTVTGARGLDFSVTGAATSPSGNMTFTDLIGINVLSKAQISAGGANTLTATNLMGARFQIQPTRIVSGTCTVTNGVTLWIRQPNHSGTSAITNAIASRIEDYTTFSGTTPTLNYLLEVGGGTGATGTATTTSGLFRVMGNFTAAANVTPVYISEGATPTLRQLKTISTGTVTQITSITTGVTLNALSGQITTVSQTIAAGAEATFTVTNSTVAATDTISACVKSTASAGGPWLVYVSAVAAGSFDITISNLHASAAGDNTIVISFQVMPALMTYLA